jgi:hypothetical protein
MYDDVNREARLGFTKEVIGVAGSSQCCRIYRWTIQVFGSRKLDNKPAGGVSADTLTLSYASCNIDISNNSSNVKFHWLMRDNVALLFVRSHGEVQKQLLECVDKGKLVPVLN